MQPPPLRADGIWRLFLYLILAAFVLMLLPHALRAWHWLLEMLNEPVPVPFDRKWLGLGVWTVIAGVLIGIAIRLARKI